MRLVSIEIEPSLTCDEPNRLTSTNATKAMSCGARCHHDSFSSRMQTSVTTTNSRRMALTMLLLLFTIACYSHVDAQSSYNNNDYGYDDDQDDSGSGGYAPKPPPVVDNLYYDYAARQEAKVGLADGGTGMGGGGGNSGILGGWVGTGITFVTGWFAGGYYHSRSTRNKLSVKFKKEQKELYQQYYNDVYALQQQNNELINALEQYIAATQGTGQPTKSSSSASTASGQRRVK